MAKKRKGLAALGIKRGDPVPGKAGRYYAECASCRSVLLVRQTERGLYYVYCADCKRNGNGRDSGSSCKEPRSRKGFFGQRKTLAT